MRHRQGIIRHGAGIAQFSNGEASPSAASPRQGRTELNIAGAKPSTTGHCNGIAKINMTPRWFCSAWYCWGKAIQRAVMAKNAELINGMAWFGKA